MRTPRRVLEAARRRGVEVGDLRDRWGVPSHPRDDGGRAIAAAAYYELWETVMDRVGQRTFPVDAIHVAREESADVLVLACMTCETVAEALQRMARFLVLQTTAFRYSLDADPDAIRFRWERDSRCDGARYADEYMIAEMLQHSRDSTGLHLRPRVVRFRHDPPPSYSEFFGAPVVGGAERCEMVIEPETIGIRLRLSEPRLADFFQQQLVTLEESVARGEDVSTLVRRAVGSQLQHGVPTLAQVATRLGRTERTLRRHLRQSGTSFEQIVRDLRLERADEYLRGTELSLADISYALGFANPNSFHRFYRAATGLTPGDAREQLRARFSLRSQSA